MASLKNDIKVSIHDLPDYIEILWETQKVPMLWSGPGVGKSAIIKELACRSSYTIPADDELVAAYPEFAEVCGQEHTGRSVFDNRLLLMMPSDLKGVPVFDSQDKVARWLATNNFPASPFSLKERRDRLLNTDISQGDRQRMVDLLIKDMHDQFAVCFLDEISIAPKLVQGAALQLVLDRQVGTYELPDGVHVVAAGNRIDDKVGATAMSSAMVSRLIHFNLEEPDFRSWSEWAIANDIAPEIVGYLNFAQDNLYKFDANYISSKGGTVSYPCPRTWEFASDLYKSIMARNGNDVMLINIITGAVGQAAAIEFTAWATMYIDLPDANEVLDGKRKSVDFQEIVNRKSSTENAGMRRREVLSLKYAFTLSMLSQLDMDFTEERLDRLAAFYLNAHEVEDADWSSMVTNRVMGMTQGADKSARLKIFAKLYRDDNSSYSKLVNKLNEGIGRTNLVTPGVAA